MLFFKLADSFEYVVNAKNFELPHTTTLAQMALLFIGQLWFYVWICSTVALTALLLFHCDAHRASFLSSKLYAQQFEQESHLTESDSGRSKRRNAFRMGDFCGHVLPHALKVAYVDMAPS